MAKPSIGIRCALEHSTLWFHLSQNLLEGGGYEGYRELLPYSFVSDEEIRHALIMSKLPEKMTPEGREIALRVLLLPGVQSFGPRQDYFDLTLHNESHWRTVLPAVVEILRDVLGKKATVHIEPGSSQVEQWHEPLLRELKLIA
ncbi:MAG TPA: hypothetical protein VFZ48_04900 [Candidatus Saccharimonadales bacterium]